MYKASRRCWEHKVPHTETACDCQGRGTPHCQRTTTRPFSRLKGVSRSSPKGAMPGRCGRLKPPSFWPRQRPCQTGLGTGILTLNLPGP